MSRNGSAASATPAQAPPRTWTLPGNPGDVPELRRAVHDWLTEHRLPARRVGDAALVVSELAANAVVHGRGPVEVALTVTPRAIIGAVTDTGDGLPVLPAVPVEEITGEHGRGLLIVAGLVDQWWFIRRTDGPGKTVWFTLPADSAASAAG